MRILFFIYSSGQASGGHYHSLDQISREIATEEQIGLVSIGKNPSPIISKNPHFLQHIETKGLFSLISLRKKIRKTFSDFQPDILHFFDAESYNRVLMAHSLLAFPVVMTKCGGPNPFRESWQHVDHLILFSKENYDWFFRNKRYDRTRLYLIPHRVRGINLDLRAGDNIKKDTSKFNFVRVSRLGGAYEKTLMDSFLLIERLAKKFDVCFYVVGRIRDSDRFEALRNYALAKSLPVHFITDERAEKGADFLFLADFVIGTGRSLIEALSAGIPVLTPAVNSDIPVLLDRSNFESLFATNFSERNLAPEETLRTNFNSIIELIENRGTYKTRSGELSELFSDFFDISKVRTLYRQVYADSLQYERKGSLRRLNLPYILRSFFYF